MFAENVISTTDESHRVIKPVLLCEIDSLHT